MNSVLCCYFPTRIIFVDDNSRFLKGMERVLDEEVGTYDFFDNPHNALDFINNFQSHLFVPPSFSVREQKINDMYKILYNPGRYDEISTLVVDYDMPPMKGLDFFAQVKNPHIRKILYTGVADESLAISAFNQGLIDGYISKGNPNQGKILIDFVADNQMKYFRSLTDLSAESILKECISENPDEVAFFDPLFIHYFNGLIEKHGVCEYYFNALDENFILVSSTGNIGLLFVYPYQVFDTTQSDILDILDNDPSFRKQLPLSLVQDLTENQKTICMPPKRPDMYRVASNWEKYAYPVHIIHGKQPYYVIHVPDVDYMRDQKIVSFQEHRRGR